MLVSIIDQLMLQISINKDIYDIDVVHKCFYWYGDKYTVEIDEQGSTIKVTLSALEGIGDPEELLSRIKNSLIDFKTRSIVAKETKNIREMIVAKAFAHEDDFDQAPPGNYSDPVGFDPSRI